MGEEVLEAVKLAEPPAALSRSVGTHVIGDLCGIDPHLLRDQNLLMRLLRDSLEREAFTILGQQSLKFPGDASGVTGFYVLSESHAAFHSYPEYGYLAIDVFSCGGSSPDRVVGHVADALNADPSGVKTLNRRALVDPSL